MVTEETLWQSLMQFQIVPAGTGAVALTDESALLALVSERTGAAEPYVAASILMRHAAFMLTGHLSVLARQRLIWTGELQDIGLMDETADGRWTPKWSLSGGEWRPVQTEEEQKAALRRLVAGHCRHLVESLSRTTSCPPLVLWENMWGYVIWMYGQLLQTDCHVSVQAHTDLSYLLSNEAWSGIARVSPFRRFLQGQTPEQAMQQYARLTCCLYYKLPGNHKCSYCPNKKDELVCI